MSDDGFAELYKTLDSLGEVAKNIGKKAVKAGLETAIPILQKEAPKNNESLLHQAQFLDIESIKSYKSGNIWGHCGIHKGNWEKTKGLYFQNYGFINHYNNTFVNKNIGWMQRAFEKCNGKSESEMLRVVAEEVNKLI